MFSDVHKLTDVELHCYCVCTIDSVLSVHVCKTTGIFPGYAVSSTIIVYYQEFVVAVA